ncbi:unnamed protein product [Acanthosepion pharaonis]|uniref:Uncharacterized protein n=1 Tax=Acanthosepion pharaonis TaxID=158019 RepID=A0A812AUT2_ACAPH|nr:unnamed protein product [Sepia pharaonis]
MNKYLNKKFSVSVSFFISFFSFLLRPIYHSNYKLISFTLSFSFSLSLFVTITPLFISHYLFFSLFISFYSLLSLIFFLLYLFILLRFPFFFSDSAFFFLLVLTSLNFPFPFNYFFFFTRLFLFVFFFFYFCSPLSIFPFFLSSSFPAFYLSLLLSVQNAYLFPLCFILYSFTSSFSFAFLSHFINFSHPACLLSLMIFIIPLLTFSTKFTTKHLSFYLSIYLSIFPLTLTPLNAVDPIFRYIFLIIPV